MASRRKASVPCMIRPDRTLVEMDDEDEDSHDMEVCGPTSPPPENEIGHPCSNDESPLLGADAK